MGKCNDLLFNKQTKNYYLWILESENDTFTVPLIVLTRINSLLNKIKNNYFDIYRDKREMQQELTNSWTAR